jgi:hypothetical protein
MPTPAALPAAAGAGFPFATLGQVASGFLTGFQPGAGPSFAESGSGPIIVTIGGLNDRPVSPAPGLFSQYAGAGVLPAGRDVTGQITLGIAIAVASAIAFAVLRGRA